jgi:hypothetical protein
MDTDFPIHVTEMTAAEIPANTSFFFVSPVISMVYNR